MPLKTKSGTLNVVRSSSPIAVGLIPKSDSGRKPAMVPGVSDGVPGMAPARAAPFFSTLNGLTTLAPLAPATGTFSDVVVVKSAVVSLKVPLVAVTVHLLVCSSPIAAGVQVWLTFTSPCLGANATGRCSVGTPPVTGTRRTSPKYWPCAAFDLMVMLICWLLPGATENRPGVAVMEEPLGDVVSTRYSSVLFVTFFAVRTAVSLPGMTGAFTDGRLICTALTGSLPRANS